MAPTTPFESLRRDNRGAVLIIGLFVALSLCGALWMLIGIGDAILFRERGQEAADAAALSAASTHARAMNSMGAANLVMLVQVGAYLSFSVIADLALVIASFLVGVSFAQKAGGDFGARALETFRTLTQFEQAMARSFATVHQAQSSLATGAPLLGTVVARALDGGRHYGVATLGWSNFSNQRIARLGEQPPFSARPTSPSPSLKTPPKCTSPGQVCTMANSFFPVLRHPPPWDPGRNDEHSLGLPVATEPASALCVRVGSLLFKDFGDAVDPLNLGDVAERSMRIMTARDKKLPLPVHCSDDVNRNVISPMTDTARPRNVWKTNGPMRMTAANGDRTMRVLAWATTPGEYLTDVSTSRVKLGSYDFSGKNDRSTPVYDAQAEFYFDCHGRWGNEVCNGGEIGVSGVGYEHALYDMNWRARLVRTRTPVEIFARAWPTALQLGGTLVPRAGVTTGEWQRIADHLGQDAHSETSSLH